ncbi:hypothetical protein [Chrysiogenes arsenatis]|uniref:hypothetical protein n=1 Tax=Chrysiogenes arsenatis TaxID=309797 RepID=UPI0004223E7D|nr:hypothetical protein [Chrysiogenes arsenatis]
MTTERIRSIEWFTSAVAFVLGGALSLLDVRYGLGFALGSLLSVYSLRQIRVGVAENLLNESLAFAVKVLVRRFYARYIVAAIVIALAISSGWFSIWWICVGLASSIATLCLWVVWIERRSTS